MCMYLFKLVFSFFPPYIQSRIAGSHGSSVFRFLSHTVFHTGCSNLQSCQQCTGSPFLHLCQKWLFVVFLMIATLRGMKWYLPVVLTCIFPMTRNVEHFFHMPDGSVSVQVFCPFLIELFIFWHWVVWAVYIFCLYILYINCLSIIIFKYYIILYANIFFHSVDCLFILSKVSFAIQNILTKLDIS